MAPRPGGKGRRARPKGRAPSARAPSPRPKTLSSARWLERQKRDPYVAEAKRQGYRSRAAFKLIELDDRFHLLKSGQAIVDLGAAPGGWSQVAVERAKGARVVAVDLAAVLSLPGVHVVRVDILAPEAPALIRAALGRPADLVLCDMSPPASGHPDVDHLRVVGLVEAALALAADILRPGGAFVAKLFQGAEEQAVVAAARRLFASVRHAKPPASRAESAEVYLVATGFKG